MVASERWISYVNNRFRLYDQKYKGSNVISLPYVRKLIREQNITLTKPAQDALEKPPHGAGSYHDPEHHNELMDAVEESYET